MKNVHNIIRWIVVIIVSIFALTNAISLFKNVVLKEDTPYVLNYTSFIVASDSMKPKFGIDDFIIDKKINSEKDIDVGDIISYKYGEDIITNRISKIVVQDGEKLYIMKGDNTEIFVTINFLQMRGKYVYKIPYLGKLYKFIRTSLGLSISVAIIIIVIILGIVYEKRKKKKVIEKINEIKEEMENTTTEINKLQSDDANKK